MKPPRLVVFFLSWFLWTAPAPPLLSSCWAASWQACSSSSNSGDSGGICPAGDTCCATSTPGVSTCISGKVKERLGRLGDGGGVVVVVVEGDHAGSCCLDDDDDRSGSSSFATTGCGTGFQCAIANSSSSSGGGSYRYCRRMDDEDDEMNPPRLPRYRLCSLPDKALKEVYGFPVAPYVVTNTTEHQKDSPPPLLFAYYSNMGPIDGTTGDNSNNDTVGGDVVSNTFATVKKVIIVIHGSARNADDYLCCMNAALPPVPGRSHNHVNPSNSTILVIAPWFLALSDLPVNITRTTTAATARATFSSVAEPLVWSQFGPIEHTWRYGADAVNSNVSSYAAVDAILDYIVATMNQNDDNSRRRFENLRDIVVIGHSAGGQYTQRWALLSNSTAFAMTATTDTSTQIIKQPSIRIIVANPKAFAYLDNRRYFVEQEEEQDDDEMENSNHNNYSANRLVPPISSMSFRIPDERSLKRCPDYDEWEWGFSKTRDGHDDFLPTPYKDRAIAAAAAAASSSLGAKNGTYESGVQVMVERYGLQRHVIYLAGQLDVLLNGELCHESIQGDYRRQRSFRFFKSLSEIFKKRRHIHYRLVVHGVHHDHCLMFQSPEGQQAMFGNFFHDDDAIYFDDDDRDKHHNVKANLKRRLD